MTLWMLVTALLGCDGGRYENHDLDLLTRYRARELCSCLFVSERTEEECRAYTVAAPNLATYHVNTEERWVHTEGLGYFDATARWVDERHGCVLDPSPKYDTP